MEPLQCPDEIVLAQCSTKLGKLYTLHFLPANTRLLTPASSLHASFPATAPRVLLIAIGDGWGFGFHGCPDLFIGQMVFIAQRSLLRVGKGWGHQGCISKTPGLSSLQRVPRGSSQIPFVSSRVRVVTFSGSSTQTQCQVPTEQIITDSKRLLWLFHQLMSSPRARPRSRSALHLLCPHLLAGSRCLW